MEQSEDPRKLERKIEQARQWTQRRLGRLRALVEELKQRLR